MPARRGASVTAPESVAFRPRSSIRPRLTVMSSRGRGALGRLVVAGADEPAAPGPPPPPHATTSTTAGTRRQIRRVALRYPQSLRVGRGNVTAPSAAEVARRHPARRAELRRHLAPRRPAADDAQRLARGDRPGDAAVRGRAQRVAPDARHGDRPLRRAQPAARGSTERGRQRAVAAGNPAEDGNPDLPGRPP